jgi:hypothetical protein
MFLHNFLWGFIIADGDFERDLDAVTNGGARDGGDGSWVRRQGWGERNEMSTKITISQQWRTKATPPTPHVFATQGV